MVFWALTTGIFFSYFDPPPLPHAQKSDGLMVYLHTIPSMPNSFFSFCLFLSVISGDFCLEHFVPLFCHISSFWAFHVVFWGHHCPPSFMCVFANADCESQGAAWLTADFCVQSVQSHRDKTAKYILELGIDWRHNISLAINMIQCHVIYKKCVTLKLAKKYMWKPLPA